MPNSLMLDIHLHKEATASSPPPQPTLSGEPQPVPLWPLSLLQPSPLPSSPPNPPIALTDNHQLQLLLLLHPVTPQPLGHSLTVHITVNNIPLRVFILYSHLIKISFHLTNNVSNLGKLCIIIYIQYYC